MPQVLLIESTRRDTGSTSSTDFKYTLQQDLDVEAVELDFILVPLAIYQITEDNKELFVIDNGNSDSVMLTEGTYNAVDLAAEATTQLNTLGYGSTWTVSYSASTFKMTFVSNQSFTLKWSLGGPYSAFGYTTSDAVGAAVFATFVSQSTNTIQVSGPLGLNLSIREFDDTVWNGGISFQGTFQFPIDTSIGAISAYNPARPYINDLINYKTVKTLHIKLTDFTGTVVDINDQEWVAKLYIYNKYDREGAPGVRSRRFRPY